MRRWHFVWLLLSIWMAEPASGQWIGGSRWGARRAWSNRGPANVTWYTVGGGYSSSLQTGLPWRRQFATYDRPFTLPADPSGTGSVARYSRVTSRDYYARVVNLPDGRAMEPAAPTAPGPSPESTVEIVRGDGMSNPGEAMVPSASEPSSPAGRPAASPQFQSAPGPTSPAPAPSR